MKNLFQARCGVPFMLIFYGLGWGAIKASVSEGWCAG